MKDPFEGFSRSSEFLVCVDSDGCAMDTMNPKHMCCFGPEWIRTFGLESRAAEALELWLSLNLYTRTRGINRFAGLAQANREMFQRGADMADMAPLERWVRESPELSNAALKAEIARNPAPCLSMALEWSRNVNAAIARMPPGQPYDGVLECLRSMAENADIVGVSSANGDAVRAEWTRHGLVEHVRTLCCQEAGSKRDVIARLLAYGYAPEHVLMVGDAYGDMKAAHSNDVLFYPILVGREAHSWHKLQVEAFPKLLRGEFSAEMQAQLIGVMAEALP